MAMPETVVRDSLLGTKDSFGLSKCGRGNTGSKKSHVNLAQFIMYNVTITNSFLIFVVSSKLFFSQPVILPFVSQFLLKGRGK